MGEHKTETFRMHPKSHLKVESILSGYFRHTSGLNPSETGIVKQVMTGEGMQWGRNNKPDIVEDMSALKTRRFEKFEEFERFGRFSDGFVSYKRAIPLTKP